jgi:hypothetical protein
MFIGEKFGQRLAAITGVTLRHLIATRLAKRTDGQPGSFAVGARWPIACFDPHRFEQIDQRRLIDLDVAVARAPPAVAELAHARPVATDRHLITLEILGECSGPLDVAAVNHDINRPTSPGRCVGVDQLNLDPF